jgi:hypothetical protein
MNLLETNANGGMPFELDDLRWLQDAWRMGFGAILKEFSDANGRKLILSGCEISPNGTNPVTHSDISSGYVLIDEEVFLVPAYTNIANSALPQKYYRIATPVADPSGNDVYEDSTVHDTYIIREAELVTILSAVSYRIIAVQDPYHRLKNLIANANIYPEYDVNLETTVVGGWSLTSTIGGGTVIQSDLIATKRLGLVTLRGRVEGGTAVNTLFATLSAGFRPTTSGFEFICPYGGDGLALVRIQSDGGMYVTTFAAPTIADQLELSGISFIVE